MSTTVHSIGEAKAHLSRILRDLEHGGEVIITRRGRPCGRLTAVDGRAEDKSSMATLRDSFSKLPALATKAPGPRPEDGGHDDR